MTLAADLAALIGPNKVRTGEAVAALDPGFDDRNLAAGLVVFPESTEDVCRLLAFADERGIAIVPQGGRTGLAGGAASRPGDVVLSLQRLNRIVEIDAAAATATVEAGVILEQLDAALAPHGLTLGVDLGARGSATIGGMISTNAGGIEAFRHGVMRQRVLGLEAVLADGAVMSDLSHVAKCNEGYDIKQLFIGAEGTLGVVTRAVLRLAPRPSQRATALVSMASAADAVSLFHVLNGQGLLAFELMGGRYFRLAVEAHGIERLAPLARAAQFAFIVEIEADEDALAEALSSAGVEEALLAKSAVERTELWKLREDSWAVDRKFPGGLWYDISVPLSDIDQYLQQLEGKLAAVAPAAQAFVIGHLGDGNLHLTIAGPQPLAALAGDVTKLVYENLKDMGGSISAEHGIGLEKRESLARLGDPGKLAAMRLIKQSLDPRGIMNPGKVLAQIAKRQ